MCLCRCLCGRGGILGTDELAGAEVMWAGDTWTMLTVPCPRGHGAWIGNRGTWLGQACGGIALIPGWG